MNIAWFPNGDGLGGFGSKQLVTSSTHLPSSAAAADLDGDGDLDVLGAQYSYGLVHWYPNSDGLGSFGPGVLIADAGHCRCAVAADLDGDGDLDALWAAFDHGWVAWNPNSDGLGTFGANRIISSAADGVDCVAAADLDSDGDLDVLSASAPIVTDTVAWYENNGGAGAFGPAQAIATYDGYFTSVVPADLDGDGDPDVLSTAAAADKIEWFANLQAPLMADVDAIALASGGAQQFSLTAGVDSQLQLYILLGSLSGTTPGLLVDGLTLPLNPDAYFLHTLAHPNSMSLVDTLGTLATNGTAEASLVLPPGLSPALAGAVAHHAYGIFDLASSPGNPYLCFASNCVALELEP